MNAKTIKSSSISVINNSAEDSSGSVSEYTVIQAASCEIIPFGSGKGTEYLTYSDTSSVGVAGKIKPSGIEARDKNGSASIGKDIPFKETAIDENWDAIVLKYSGRPMTLKDYYQMVFDFQRIANVKNKKRT